MFEVKKRWRGIRDYRRMKLANGIEDDTSGKYEMLKVEPESPEPDVEVQAEVEGDDDSMAHIDASESSVSDPQDNSSSYYNESASIRSNNEEQVVQAAGNSKYDMLFMYFASSVAGLPPDLQRRCRLDVMEIINRYEEMAGYRANTDNEDVSN